MCQQVKMQFTDCPHVARDLDIIPYANLTTCRFKTTQTPDYVWHKQREPGKCHFCILEDEDKKEKRKRRAAWNTDL
jgi:hypothetical protein